MVEVARAVGIEGGPVNKTIDGDVVLGSFAAPYSLLAILDSCSLPLLCRSSDSAHSEGAPIVPRGIASVFGTVHLGSYILGSSLGFGCVECHHHSANQPYALYTNHTAKIHLIHAHRAPLMYRDRRTG